jgi:hypothetical protein
MTFKIQSGPTPDHEQLRALLLDAAEQLLGAGSSLLEPRLRFDGEPMLFADAALHPVLVSFDPDNSESALLNGLRAVEYLSNALPWINQVYEPLQQKQHPPRLVVVSGAFPPAASVTLCGCPGLTLFRYQLLRANEEDALWLLALAPADVTCPTQQLPTQQTGAPLPERASNDLLPELSEAENAYFQQL